MLEVVEKADRLHVEENLQRSMSASASSPDQPLIEFKEVCAQPPIIVWMSFHCSFPLKIFSLPVLVS